MSILKNNHLHSPIVLLGGVKQVVWFLVYLKKLTGWTLKKPTKRVLLKKYFWPSWSGTIIRKALIYRISGRKIGISWWMREGKTNPIYWQFKVEYTLRMVV